MKRTLTKGLIIGAILGLAFAEGGILPATTLASATSITGATPITSSSVTSATSSSTSQIAKPLNGDTVNIQKTQTVLPISAQQGTATKYGVQGTSTQDSQSTTQSSNQTAQTSSQVGQNTQRPLINGVSSNQGENKVSIKSG